MHDLFPNDNIPGGPDHVREIRVIENLGEQIVTAKRVRVWDYVQFGNRPGRSSEHLLSRFGTFLRLSISLSNRRSKASSSP